MCRAKNGGEWKKLENNEASEARDERHKVMLVGAL